MQGVSQEIVHLLFFSMVTSQLHTLLSGSLQCCDSLPGTRLCCACLTPLLP